MIEENKTTSSELETAKNAAAKSYAEAGKAVDSATSAAGATLSATSDEAGSTASSLKDKASDTAVAAREKVMSAYETSKDKAAVAFGDAKERAVSYADTAGMKARDAAEGGKSKAAEAVAGLARIIEDSAPSVDARLGAQYGDYARTAARSVNDFATTLETKNVDELIASGKDAAKRNPVAAAGIAVAGAWLLSKLLRGGR